VTGDVHLRPITEDDLPLLERMAADREEFGELAWAGFTSPVQIRKRYHEDGYLATDNGRLIACLGSEPIGTVSWLRVAHGPPPSWCWNMGISLLVEHRGRGLGTRAQQRLVDYLFRTSDAVRIEAQTLVDNLAEQRALERTGFAREGVLRSAQFLDGAWRDVAVYSRLRREWEGGPALMG